MDYEALRTLIETHPQWPSVDDEALAAWVNEEAINADRATLPATEVLTSILTYRTEWNALTAADQATVRDILYIASGEGVPTAPGNPIRAVLVDILGTQTKQALGSQISYQISRAEGAGVLGSVTQGDVEHARTI